MDRLDTIIDNHACWKIHDLLQELKQRRKYDLRPADKFLGNSRLEQYMHIDSELKEVRTAMNDYALEYTDTLDNLIEELIDLQMSCETMLAILGLDEQQRREARSRVIEKNRLRGYYEGGAKMKVKIIKG